MADPVQTPTAPATPQQNTPKDTANNIVKGIQNKANGKAPVAPPPTNGQDPQATPVDTNAGKKKYVVDQREVWLTPQQADAYVQKGIAFEPKVDQLYYLQKETGEFLKTLATDPIKILTDKRIGLTPQAVMEKIFTSGQISDEMKESVGKWYYENVVAPMKMSPEERELMEKTKKLTEYERREALARDMAIQQENKRRAEIAGQQLLGFVREAMKESGLPDINTPLGTLYARRTLELSRVAAKAGQSITPKEAIEKVRLEMKEFNSIWLDNLDEEQIVKELGEKNAEKVKKYFLKLVKEAQKESTVSNAKPVGRTGERKTINQDDFHDYLDKLKREGK